MSGLLAIPTTRFMLRCVHFFVFSRGEGQAKRELTSDEETFLLIQCLRDANLPRFIAEDVPLFESLMSDLFPESRLPQPDLDCLEVNWSRLVFAGVPLTFHKVQLCLQ